MASSESAAQFHIVSATTTSGNLVITGAGGTPNGAYALLTAATGAFFASGNFTGTLPIDANKPTAFVAGCAP